MHNLTFPPTNGVWEGNACVAPTRRFASLERTASPLPHPAFLWTFRRQAVVIRSYFGTC